MPATQFGLGAVGGGSVPNNLLYPGISQLIIETALPAQVARQLLFQHPTDGKQSLTIPTESGSKTAVASRVGEGDEIPLDVSPINSSTVTVYKIGRGHAISREMVMFQQIPVIQHYLKRLGLVMGNTIDFDVLTTIDAGAGTSTAVAGTSLGTDGTVFTIANSVGQFDIVNAKKRLMVNNLFPDSLVLSPKQWAQISKLPMYHADYLYGRPAYETGELGNIEGLRVLVSQQAETVSANSSYVVNTGLTSTPLGQFVPAGYFLEALPITSMVQDTPRRDGYEVYAVSMFVPVVTKGECIEKLTGASA